MALLVIFSVGWALTWLVWRAYQVLQTPNEVLVDKLGLDIPPALELILEEISSRQIHVAWKQPETPNSIHKHVIHINGKKAGETKRTESSISISNLTPGALYSVRVFTVSAAGFQTASHPLCLRTSVCDNGLADIASEENSPMIRASQGKPTPSIPLLSSTGLSREFSISQTNGRRSFAGRKQSSAEPGYVANADESSRSLSEDEGECDFAQLQRRFQKVQQDNEAAEAQILKEEREFEAATKQFESRRDEIKHSLKERDEASSDLRKQVHKLESANRSAQNERSKKEKLLHQKENQRRKRRDESANWEVQIATMADEIAGIQTQKKALEKRTASSIAELRQNVEDEQKEVKCAEEDNKERVSQIKALEEDRKRLNEGEETEESRETDRVEWEKDRQWQENLFALNMSYGALANAVSHAKIKHDMVRERLSFLQRARIASTANSFTPLPHLDMEFMRPGPKQRRPRQRSSLASSISSPNHLPNLDAFASPRGYNNSTNGSPTYGPGTAFFSTTNGMTLHGPTELSMSPEDADALTGGGPMSPRADALLPANLLGDESADDFSGEDVNKPTQPEHTEGPRPRFSSVAQNSSPDAQYQDRPSPHSSSSRSASIFTSPGHSIYNLPDVDRASTNSAHLSVDKSSPSVGPQTGSRNFVSGIFGFNRQRGKVIPDEPPMLGSLKSGESQSFPRNFGESLDPLARRRRLSYGGNWAAPMTNLFPRNGPVNDKDGGLSRLSSSRRGFPSLFSTKLNPANLPALGKQTSSSSGYDQFSPRNNSGDFTSMGNIRGDVTSSRPSSVYSFDRLPRPSTDTQPFGWGNPERSTLRGSPLVPDWAGAPKWSQSPSRRTSAVFGSSSNLSLQPPAEDIYEESQSISRPLQAPIGTRPASSQRPTTPKLNPAAPSFTTLFARSKDKTKDKEKDKSKEKKEKEKENVKSKEIEVLKPSDGEYQPTNDSPPTSRKSKDSRTAGSMTESRESLDRITSTTLSDTPPSKETFIQKITRKSSSNKFNSWKDKGGLFSSRKDSPSTPGEVDEDATSEAQLGRSLESTSTTPSGDKEKERPGRSSLSWAFMRKSKKGERIDLTTSEVSESSEKSETENEDGVERPSLTA